MTGYELLAQTATPTNILGIFAPYVDLGFIVLLVFLFFTGKIRRESEVKDREAEIRELKASIKQQLEHYQEEVLPALIEVTRVSGEVVAYLNKRRN